MRLLNIFCGASALILLVTSCGNKQGSSEQAPIQKYPVSGVDRQAVRLESVYPVTIKGKEDIEIRPRIDGFIDAIYVDEGAVVKKGQPLFKINSPQSEQALNSARAAIKSARAQVNIARVDVSRIRPLVEKNIVSKVELEIAESTCQAELAALAQAEATLKNAEATMGWTNVTSPVDGLVGEISYRQGSLVDSDKLLTTVANTSNAFAYFSLNEKDLYTFLDNLEGDTQVEKLKKAPEIILTLANGTAYEYPGKIETITGSINTTTGTASFRAEFPNKEGKLRSGSSGKISVPRYIENAMVIPQKATYARQNKTLVYLVQGDSVIQKVISVLPTPDGKSYVVIDGLKDGDRIVTDGIATLSQGKKIRTE